MDKQVDSYRYLSGITKRMIKSWIKMEQPRPIPWTPLRKQLSESTVAMISTGGIVNLPFEWPEPPKQVENHPPEDPPIGRYLQRHPWFLPKLLARDVPA